MPEHGEVYRFVPFDQSINRSQVERVMRMPAVEQVADAHCELERQFRFPCVQNCSAVHLTSDAGKPEHKHGILVWCAEVSATTIPKRRQHGPSPPECLVLEKVQDLPK